MRRILWLLALALLLSLPLAFLVQDFARDKLAVELLRLYQAARLVFESLPQALVLAAFLVFALLAAAGSLFLPARLAGQVAHSRPRAQGRVQVLTRWIQHAAEAEYFRWRLAQHLGAVAREVVAHQEGIDPQDLKEQLRSGRLDLPPAVQDYLYARPDYSARTSMDLRSRLGRWLGLDAGTQRPDPALESVVRFLEEQMEVEHEPRTR